MNHHLSKCPVKNCGILLDVLQVAFHLSDDHDWKPKKVLDWMRDEEEAR